MKLLILALVALTFLPTNAIAHGSDEDVPATQAELKDKDILVKIEGMSCEPCVQTVKKVFGKQESVEGTYVVLEDQTLTLDTKDGQTLSDEKIRELIEWGGYDLVSIERLK